jgi:hypothetical protein
MLTDCRIRFQNLTNFEQGWEGGNLCLTSQEQAGKGQATHLKPFNSETARAPATLAFMQP